LEHQATPLVRTNVGLLGRYWLTDWLALGVSGHVFIEPGFESATRRSLRAALLRVGPIDALYAGAHLTATWTLLAGQLAAVGAAEKDIDALAITGIGVTSIQPISTRDFPSTVAPSALLGLELRLHVTDFLALSLGVSSYFIIARQENLNVHPTIPLTPAAGSPGSLTDPIVLTEILFRTAITAFLPFERAE